MRRLLVVATVLVFLAGTSLYLAPTQTQTWFAWTVNPPLTASFLGAAYWASATVEATSARVGAWANARVAVPGVLSFTVVTFVVTVVHLDKFHLGGDVPPRTRAIAWAWLAIYALVPVLLAVLWVRQQSVAGVDPARTRPLPTWLRAAVAAMGALLAVGGVALLLAPDAAGQQWPWELTPLTARAIGAWLLGLGVSACAVAVEADAVRARPVAVGAVALAALAAGALVRHSGTVDWSSAGARLLGAALLVWAVLGAAIIACERRSDVTP